MEEETKKLIKELLPVWQQARDLQNRDVIKRERWKNDFETVNGYFSWNNESLVLLCNFIKKFGYEEFGSIIGLTKDGKLVWEYQSHCSCNDFSDSKSFGGEMKHEHILEKKTLELEQVPPTWENDVQKSIKVLLGHLTTNP